MSAFRIIGGTCVFPICSLTIEKSAGVRTGIFTFGFSRGTCIVSFLNKYVRCLRWGWNCCLQNYFHAIKFKKVFAKKANSLFCILLDLPFILSKLP